uniref:Uncharacterized protein n=1 Tax=Gossypium raimondii TaxID=29730 RepID=A0A0D2QMH2_GOSRA|nr:hypothetical protein B456_003G175500 [Gossypium raimondii]
MRYVVIRVKAPVKAPVMPENTCTVQGCADIQNSLPAVAEVHHNPVMHGLTKKSAEAKGKRSVEEIKDEAYIKKGKMKVVNDN